jgi:pyruvate dehydrogenase E1 component alpha subunit
MARQMYTTMRLAEAVDDRLRRGIMSGEFPAVIWPSRGQEAVPAGLCAALRRDDRLVTTYRGLHDMVSKGVPLVQILGEVVGHGAGASRGKAGTMHITCPDVGLMLTTGIVGAGLPVAVGLALAARQQGSDRVVAVCFGDGATNTGSFHEALNLASTWKLPVIAVCQNNLWAEMTPIEHTMNIEQVAYRAQAFNIPGVRVDGNDPEAVLAAGTEAVGRARSGGGPTLLDCVTFRFNGHYVGDPQPYMPKDQLAAAENNDPIPLYRKKLIDARGFAEHELAAIDQDARDQVEQALKQALASPVPSADELEKDFFENMKGIPS